MHASRSQGHKVKVFVKDKSKQFETKSSTKKINRIKVVTASNEVNSIVNINHNKPP